MKTLFIIIMFVWAFIGFIGILNCKKNGIRWDMIIFCAFVPFIPLVAKVCGLI